MSKRLLILGDSHVSFFQNIYHGGFHHGHGYGFKPPQRTSKFDHKKPYDSLDIQVCKAQGATAYGILNTESETLANKIFCDFINNKIVEDKQKPSIKYHADIEANPPDYVCFFLGEIDCRGLVALQLSLKKYNSFQDILKKSVENLYQFCSDKIFNKVVDPDRVIFLSPHLSKSIDPRDEELITLEHLTERTYFFSELLSEFSDIRHISVNDQIIDKEKNIAQQEFLDGSDCIHLNGINIYNNKISTLWAEELCKLPDCDPNELHKLGFHDGKNIDGGTGRWAKSNEEGKHSSSWRDWPCQTKKN